MMHSLWRGRASALLVVLVIGMMTGCLDSHIATPDRRGNAMDGGAEPRADVGPGFDSGLDTGLGPFDDGVALDEGLPDAGSPAMSPIVSGNDVIVDAFVAEAGIIVVLQERVLLIDRGGEVVEEWLSSRQVTSAAFDGTYLGIADGAVLTTLNVGLAEVGSVFLTEPCASSVVLGEHRFVCGPANDWDRIFYTYDLETSARLATSSPYTYNGIPMRAVPGRDAFIAVTTESSPSDLHYYDADPGGMVRFINESPYHGAFGVTGTYAFNAPDATHVVTHEGLLLLIDPCEEGSSSESTCFTRDGTLGTLRSGEEYVGMDTGSDGYLYTLVGDGEVWRGDPRCEGGCTLQRIDVAARGVVASQPWSTTLESVAAFRHDSETGGVVIAAHARCDFGSDCQGWLVYAASL